MTAAPGRAPGLLLDASRAIEQARIAVRTGGRELEGRGEFHRLTVDRGGRARFQALGAAQAELQLETEAVTLGGRSLLAGARARGDGSTVVLSRGAVEERLENRLDGVEQRWLLARRPDDPGDLEVRVRVSGLPLAGTTAGGHHFGRAGSGALVRYGPATLVDASGVRTLLATRFAAGLIRISVPSAALSGATFPVAIDPVISAEASLDTPPGGFAASGEQVKPSVACLPTGTCLVAWQDQVLQSQGGGSQVRAARVSGAALTDLDANGIDVDTGAGGNDCGPPVVVTVSGVFNVVYTCTDATLRRLRLARVSEAGALVGGPITLSQDAAGNVFSFSAASDGTNLGVTWSDIQEIRFMKVAPGATTAGTIVTPVPKSTVPADESARWDRSAITWSGTRWFLAWRGSLGTAPNQSQVIRVAFLDAAGTFQPGETNGFYVMGTYGAGFQEFFAQPVVAADGLDHVLLLVARNTAGEPYPGVVSAMRFGLHASDWVAGGISNIPGIWGDNAVMGISNWWDGTSFSVLLQYQGSSGGMTAERRTVPALPFTVSPLLLDAAKTTPLFPAAGTTVDSIRGASDGASGVMLAYEDRPAGQGDVKAGRPNGTDARVGSLLLTTGAANEGRAAVAYSGGTWLVAWEDQRSVAAGTDSDVFAVRLAHATGAPLDTSPLHLTSALGAQGQVLAAGGPSGFLVTWADFAQGNIDIRDTWVGTNGALPIPAGAAVATIAARAEIPQALAFDGTQFHLLYSEEDPGTPANASLKDIRINPTTLTTQGPITVATPIDPAHHLQGKLACRTDGCLAVYGEELTSSLTVRSIVAGTTPAAAVNLVSGLAFPPSPFVSALSTGTPPFLVGWSVSDYGTQKSDVVARQVLLNGAVTGGPITIASAFSGLAPEPVASFDGIDHVVAWSPATGGLVGDWVRPDGVVRDVPSYLVTSGSAAPRNFLSTVGDGEGRTLAAYQVFDATPGVRAMRLKVRIAAYSLLLGDACVTATDCGSGFCVEGVCCDSACGGGTAACLTCSARNGHGTPGHCTATKDDLCNDGVACTSGDRCDNSGVCAGIAYTCVATQCQLASACDGAGGCTPTNKPDTAGCDDGNACTWGDHCASGACTGTPITCTPGTCETSSTCNGTSSCTVVKKPDLASCDDGNACTVNDVCQSGSCSAGSPVTCPASTNPCQGGAGTCQPASGSCTYVAVPDGSPCDGGTCQAGQCQGSAAQVLGFSCAAGPAGPEALLLGLLALAFTTRRTTLRRTRRSA